MTTVLQDRIEPVRGEPRWDRSPLVKTVFYTLDISARFLAASAVGRGSIALADRLLDGYWRRIFQSGNARLLVEGREHFDGRPAVVMSNHRSLLDIPALMGAVPGSLRMVMKEELTRVPIWGAALVKSGFIPVRRGSKEKAIEQLAVAERELGRGVHVWIAPEGTRSRTGALLPFKKGGFHLAASLRAPIVPAWIEGTATTVPPDELRARRDSTVVVRFGRPIETVPRRSADELVAEVRASMLALAGLDPEPPPAPAPGVRAAAVAAT
jgi:1-acyl-sn-glycerol-3-phosphate acyltransferase